MTLASWQTFAVKLGTANGTAIVAQASTGTLASIVSVTLTASYARAADPAYPVADAGSRACLSSPQTIPEGTVLKVYSDEAAALVAAGVATYS